MYNLHSYYFKLAHKALHNYLPTAMQSVVMDVEFVYLGVDSNGEQAFSILNFLDSN